MLFPNLCWLYIHELCKSFKNIKFTNASAHNGYVAEQINGVVQVWPKIVKKEGGGEYQRYLVTGLVILISSKKKDLKRKIRKKHASPCRFTTEDIHNFPAKNITIKQTRRNASK